VVVAAEESSAFAFFFDFFFSGVEEVSEPDCEPWPEAWAPITHSIKPRIVARTASLFLRMVFLAFFGQRSPATENSR
jgi:hypothetical protein